MKTLIIIYILSMLFSYIKLFHEKKFGRIGIISILIITSYYGIFSLIMAILNYLKMNEILNFVILIDIIIISCCNTLYSIISMLAIRKSKYLKKLLAFDVINAIANIVFLIIACKI